MQLPDDFAIAPLVEGVTVPAFDCGNDDLTGFLADDALSHHTQLIAVTYLVTSRDSLLGYFSLLNDKIAVEDFSSKRKWMLFRDKREIPTQKRYASYPAVKIGRFAVAKGVARTGIGTAMMDILKMVFTVDNRTGCRFITVDAYNNEQTMAFYEKNDFQPLTEDDKDEETRLLYTDLKPFRDELNQAGQDVDPANMLGFLGGTLDMHGAGNAQSSGQPG